MKFFRILRVFASFLGANKPLYKPIKTIHASLIKNPCFN